MARYSSGKIDRFFKGDCLKSVVIGVTGTIAMLTLPKISDKTGQALTWLKDKIGGGLK